MRNVLEITVVDGREFATTPMIAGGFFGFTLPDGSTQQHRNFNLDIGDSATVVVWAPPEPPSNE